MLHMNNDKVGKLDWRDYHSNQQYIYNHQKLKLCTELVKNNKMYILSKMNRWDKYFCKVYMLDLYHHHNILSYKDKIYRVEVSFERIKDKQYIKEDQVLYSHYIDKDI